MDSMTVKVSDLWAIANLMKTDKMSYVTLSILEADDECPASIEFEAVSNDDPDCGVVYDGIEEYQPDI